MTRFHARSDRTPTLVAAAALAATAMGAGALWATASWAHHSTAMFDADNRAEIVGTVKEFQWTNPHTWLQLEVEDDAGAVVEWSLEWSSPNILGRRGVRPTTFKPGDQVTIQINPLRNGAPGGWLVSAQLPDGDVIGDWRETSVQAAAQ